tara:strand:- start:66 stop:656 length:591 start_codon:yes stop_codon:yes gene_type:complete
MENCLSLLKKNLSDSIQAKQLLLEDEQMQAEFVTAAEMVLKKYLTGGRLYIMGNGGSAADAQHLAAEFVSKLAADRDPLPAEALTVDTSILTAIGNDYGYDELFARQIIGKVNKDDCVLAISTSGNSKNILKGLKTCSERGISTLLFTGNDGGMAKALADFCIIAPGNHTGTIQEIHIVLAHTLCGYIENRIFDHP